MRILVLTDDLVGPEMAGSALRAWELARVLLGAGHEVVLSAASGSAHPEGHGPPVVDRPPWSWSDVVLAPPWCLPPRAFLGQHLLVVDGVTPLLAELDACPTTPEIIRRRRTASARMPLVISRADGVLIASEEQALWWSNRLGKRTDVPLIQVPFGIPETDPSGDVDPIEGVPAGWSVVLWWGGVWPWLDLETLLAARARLGSAKVSVVVPTAKRPGGGVTMTTRDLEAAAARHGLRGPAVVPLECWVPYADRDRILNRSAVLAVLHHPGPETELSFRTRVLDGVWAAVPLLLSEGGAAARTANAEGWGAVVPPGDAKLAAAALDLLLGDRSQDRCRALLATARDRWRWSAVAQPLVKALPGLSKSSRRRLLPAVLRAATILTGRTSENVA
jgi:glycosyltransferase involved in cell wall biosynthesis